MKGRRFATADLLPPPAGVPRDNRGLHRRRGCTHEYATGYTAPDPTAALPGVHLVASLLKRWLTGTLHYVVADHQLAEYLEENTLRYNRRTARNRGLLFQRRDRSNTRPEHVASVIVDV